MSATLRFAKLDRWQTIFPWRDWLLGHQRGVSELVAREFAGHLRRTPGD